MKPMHDDESEDILREIRNDLECVAGNCQEVWTRQETARQVRFNEWEGQSPDGRKHADSIGSDALPFEGAPDNRIPLADAAINEKVAVARRAFFRGMVQAKPTEPADAPKSANIVTLCTWLRDSAMREELETEVPLAAQYLFGDDPGLVVVEVCWLRDLALKRELLTFDALAAMFATGAASPEEALEMGGQIEPELLGEFMDLASNPIRREEWMDWLAAMFPGVTPRALRRAAADLRKSGEAELPVPAIRENRPSVRTLKFCDDVFFPVGTSDLQRARGIDRREWLSEVELRERVTTYGWGKHEVEEVIERGRGVTFLEEVAPRSRAGDSVSLSAPGSAVDERENLFEVWWSYRREADELGIPGINCTVWSPAVKDRWLKRSIADYPDGEYPFVMRRREYVGRQTTDSRGLTVPIATHQTEVKIQRDARGAYVQLTASPPMKVKIQRAAYALVLGPNAQIPVQRDDDFSPVVLPNFIQNSVEMERTTKLEVLDYCALMHKDAEPNRVGLIQQDEAENFVGLWRSVFAKVLPLAQHFYSAAELARITGQGDTPLTMTPEDIRGGWDITIEIDARDLNLEFALKKMEAFGKVLSYDVGGVLDRAPFAEWAAYAIDPILARRTVQPAGSVTRKMVDEERQNVANMALGMEPVMSPDGTTNPQFRLQTMMQTISQSPRLAQLFGGDEQFRALVENYQRYLEQQLKQEQNKVVGRLGTAPTQSVPGMYAGMDNRGAA